MKVGSSQSLVQDALRALNSGDHKIALRCFTALERLEPQNGEWSLQAGLMYHRLGKRKHAISALERAARRCHVQGQLERAVAIYQQILRFDPQNEVALRGLNAQRVPDARGSSSHHVRDQSAAPPVAMGTQGHDEVDGFGIPRSKTARVAMALSFLKG